ncbi:hypothetical protein ACQP1K_01115 [Sphaerimonospora sp. CA-214678]|uniref:hypothetical protein n=1 Tax=Sphaerimonospora sp. CA-214678 TaxID=3240029 RepID=UPI003D948804
MIAAHLEGPQIERVIPPVSLTSDAFDDMVRDIPAREAAAEMGHALRFHLEERVRREDPEKYLRLSQRLEEILKSLLGRFEEQVEELGPLIEQARREDEENPALAGLSVLEQRLYRLIEENVAGNPGVVRGEMDLRELVNMVCDTAAHVMGSVAYQGQSQDVSDLANAIHRQLLRSGLRPAGVDWTPLKIIAEGLAAYANDNRAQFLRRARGE